jgi:hypothetical protein
VLDRDTQAQGIVKSTYHGAWHTLEIFDVGDGSGGPGSVVLGKSPVFFLPHPHLQKTDERLLLSPLLRVGGKSGPLQGPQHRGSTP